MAPKRKHASASSKAVAAKKSAPEPDAPLIERDPSEEHTTPARKRLRRRSTDEAVTKKLRDNFPGWTEQQTHMHVIAGQSLFDRLKADLKTAQRNESQNSVTMGKRYYDELRSAYMASDAPQRKLVPKDDNDEIDTNLLDALTCLMRHRRSFQELYDWCETVDAINQKNFVALCRQVLKLVPMSNTETFTAVVAIMKCVSRLGLDKLYPEETAQVFGQFDRACLRSWEAFKRNDQTSRTWWEANKSWAKLVLPEKETNACMAEKSDWQNAEKELSMVSSSSETGRRLFGRAVVSLDQGRVTHMVTAAVQGIGSADITLEVLSKNRADFLKKMKDEHMDVAKSHPKKETTLQYRGVSCSITVFSILEEYNLHLEAKVRSLAVDAGIVAPLWSENDLVGKRDRPKFKVSASVVSATVLARKALAECLDNADATADNIKHTLSQKYSFLAQVDRSFKIEQAFWKGCMGTPGVTRLQESILTCLPRATKSMSLQQSDAAFKRLAGSKLLQFNGSAMQAIFSVIQGFVAAMLQGRPPNLQDATDSPFMIKVKDSMSRFCTATPSEEGSTALWGAQAARHMLAELKKKKGLNNELTLLDIKPVSTFSWLLSEEEQAELKQVTNSVVAQQMRALASSDEKPTKKSGPKKNAAQAKQMAAAMFT